MLIAWITSLMAADASTFQEIPTVRQLAEQSRAVVHGEVITSRTEPCSIGLCTTHSILVHHTLKGSAEDVVQITLPGGTHGGLTQRAAGFPLWRDGDQVFVFIDASGTIPLTGILSILDDGRTVDPLHRDRVPSTLDELTAFVQERTPGPVD